MPLVFLSPVVIHVNLECFTARTICASSIILMATLQLIAAQVSAQEKGPDVEVRLLEKPIPRFVLFNANVKSIAEAKKIFFVTVFKGNEENHADDKSRKLLSKIRVMGSYRLEGNQVVFEPRFPLSFKARYQVHLADRLSTSTETLLFSRTVEPKPSPAVQEVYPTGDILPENVLKFYVHFSQPMSRGQAYECIRLYRGSKLVTNPFLELGEELWDQQQKRFTLFLHPGRIKRGLKPNEDIGPPITGGEEYRLVIDPQWESPEGKSLASKFVKKFSVQSSDREQPNPAEWKIETPKKSSRDPVVLRFHESLDHAMLQRVLEVLDIEDISIPGKIQIGENEKSWAFVPERPWDAGVYRIEIETILEDLCGNSLDKPFEKQMAATPRSGTPTKEKIAIEFVVN